MRRCSPLASYSGIHTAPFLCSLSTNWIEESAQLSIIISSFLHLHALAGVPRKATMGDGLGEGPMGACCQCSAARQLVYHPFRGNPQFDAPSRSKHRRASYVFAIAQKQTSPCARRGEKAVFGLWHGARSSAISSQLPASHHCPTLGLCSHPLTPLLDPQTPTPKVIAWPQLLSFPDIPRCGGARHDADIVVNVCGGP